MKRWTAEPGSRGYYASGFLALFAVTVGYAATGSRLSLALMGVGAVIVAYRLLRYPPSRYSVTLKQRREQQRIAAVTPTPGRPD